MSHRNQAKIDILEDYNLALKTYKNREFEKAKVLFQTIVDKLGGDGPSQLYIERCDQYIKDPPPENWDGVYTMTTK